VFGWLTLETQADHHIPTERLQDRTKRSQFRIAYKSVCPSMHCSGAFRKPRYCVVINNYDFKNKLINNKYVSDCFSLSD